MKSAYSKDEYVGLIDFDYGFLPPGYWEYRADFDGNKLICISCGTTDSLKNPVGDDDLTCLDCVLKRS